MDVPDATERFSGQVNTVTLGATADDGGTRGNTVTVGGAKAVMLAGVAENRGCKPVIAMDVLDAPPDDWPDTLARPFEGVLDDPGAWAKRCVDDFGAGLICVKLDGTNPDKGDRSPEQAVEAVKAVLESVPVPIIVWCGGEDEKDNKVMPAVSQATKGENCALGVATEDNYKTLTAVCQADGHHIIALAPIDINKAKQVNILISDMEYPLEKIVMFQTTGALGYGLEYAYSIQERERLAALGGDRMMAQVVIADAGFESWRAKEAKGDDAEFGVWGPRDVRGPMWEATTASVLLMSGVDIIRMRHPDAVTATRKLIDALWA